jgi:hypothetical protein
MVSQPNPSATAISLNGRENWIVTSSHPPANILIGILPINAI